MHLCLGACVHPIEREMAMPAFSQLLGIHCQILHVLRSQKYKIWSLKLAQKFKAVCWPNKATSGP